MAQGCFVRRDDTGAVVGHSRGHAIPLCGAWKPDPAKGETDADRPVAAGWSEIDETDPEWLAHIAKWEAGRNG